MARDGAGRQTRPVTTPGSDPTRTRAGAAGPTNPGTTTGPATTGRTTSRERHPGRTIGRTLALALLIAVTVLLVLFVVYNTQTVQVSLVFVDVQAPLVLALVIAAALGGLLVGLAGLVLRARRRS